MAEIYPLGQNRIFYRPRRFVTGLEITVEIIDPGLKNHDEIPVEELEETPGLYSFVYDFTKEGTYIGIFYEGGEKVTSQAFSTRRIPTDGGGVRIVGSSRLINRG